ncbi:efflux RND transporter permease subunit, partial [Pseudomonas viridiflava]|uniref:efflux RND transporter permease subunit n=1 Tax=Pseudomonas viridiflava TaxID=33069 RepID=UPI00197E38AA
ESGITNTVMILGFSFSGSGQNAALAFTTLKDWSQRSAEDSAQAIADRATAVFSGLKDAMVFSLLPPPVEGLGTSGGFEVRLQDRGGQGYEALTQARDELLGRVAASPVLQNVREASLAETPQVNIEVDRQQANAMGVSFSDIASVLSTSLGSAYVNDFPNKGR